MAVFTDTTSQGYDLQFTVTVTSQNEAENYSNISWNLKLIGGGSTQNDWNLTASPWTAQISTRTANGSKTYDFRNYSSLTLGSGTTTVSHDSDGAKIATIKASFNDSGSGVGDASINTTMTLPTIGRQSTPSFSPTSVDAGSAVTITTNRESTAFTHTITYSFGSTSGTIGTGIGASTSWTPPLSLLSQIPNSTSGTATITTKTYNGSTLIGTTSKSLTIKAGSSITPDFSTITHSEANSTVATVMGSGFTSYIQNVSRLNLAISGASGIYGSTISAYELSIPGQGAGLSSWTTPGPISTSGTITITGKITDSRGRTKTKTVNVSAIAYQPPLINSVTFQRALSSGVADPNGTYIRTDLNAAITSLVAGTSSTFFTDTFATDSSASYVSPSGNTRDHDPAGGRNGTGAMNFWHTASPTSDPAVMQRTISGLTVGVSYTIRGWFRNWSQPTGTASIGVSGIGTGIAVTTNDITWQEATYTFTATATSHTVVFTGDNGSSQSDVWLDDFTITNNTASTQKNLFTYKIYSRLRGATTWDLKTTVNLAVGTLTFNSFNVVSPYLVEQSYETRVDVVDKFATTTVTGATAVAAIAQHWSETGVGIGKFHELGMLDVNGQIYQEGGPLVPPGVYVPYAGSTAPVGWLLCQGQEVSRTTYARLYTALGGASSPYGQGNGSSTFNVPDLRERVPVGQSTGSTEFGTLGTATGSKTSSHSHSLSDNGYALVLTQGTNPMIRMRRITVPTWSPNVHINATSPAAGTSADDNRATGLSGSTDDGNSSTIQPSRVAHYIIKT